MASATLTANKCGHKFLQRLSEKLVSLREGWDTIIGNHYYLQVTAVAVRHCSKYDKDLNRIRWSSN